MVYLEITKIENNYYFLKNIQNGKEIVLNLQFYGLISKLTIGDQIKIHEKLLDKNYEEYSTHYQFGPLDEPYGRKITDANSTDLLSIKTDNKVITLKRFFG